MSVVVPSGNNRVCERDVVYMYVCRISNRYSETEFRLCGRLNRVSVNNSADYTSRANLSECADLTRHRQPARVRANAGLHECADALPGRRAAPPPPPPYRLRAAALIDKATYVYFITDAGSMLVNELRKDNLS